MTTESLKAEVGSRKSIERLTTQMMANVATGFAAPAIHWQPSSPATPANPACATPKSTSTLLGPLAARWAQDLERYYCHFRLARSAQEEARPQNPPGGRRSSARCLRALAVFLSARTRALLHRFLHGSPFRPLQTESVIHLQEPARSEVPAGSARENHSLKSVEAEGATANPQREPNKATGGNASPASDQ